MNALAEPRLERRGAFAVAGFERRFTARTLDRIPALWARLAPYAGLVPGRIGDERFGLCTPEGGGAFDYLCGVEIDPRSGASAAATIAELRVRVLDEHAYLVFVHEGHVSTLRRTVEAAFAYLSASGTCPAGAPAFERYDGRFDARTARGLVEFWIPIRTQ